MENKHVSEIIGSEKKVYTPPKLVELGTVADLIQVISDILTI